MYVAGVLQAEAGLLLTMVTPTGQSGILRAREIPGACIHHVELHLRHRIAHGNIQSGKILLAIEQRHLAAEQGQRSAGDHDKDRGGHEKFQESEPARAFAVTSAVVALLMAAPYSPGR